MCGIAGMYLRAGLDVSETDLRAMGSVLQHRGPDNTGVLIQGQCGLVHTRLSLLDLSEAGNQPMVIGTDILLYNGEIYNFNELRAELVETDGVRFHSTSDTEVILQSLIVHGVEKTLKRIKGMFAFAFYEGRTQTVYLCRDRYGIKPLFWSLRDGNLYWASEVKALAQLKPLELDPTQVLFSTASTAEWRQTETLFMGIDNLPPGTYLEARPGQSPRICGYYDIIDDVDEAYYRELDALTMDEAAQRFNDLITKSVKKMLISDAPMGIFLSGGIDSSLLTALAVQSTRKLSLFTANVIGKLSEFQDATLVGKHVGMPLYDIPFEQMDSIEYLAKATYHNEAPIVRHISAMAMLRVAQLAHTNQVKAVLTGEGSDELFLGYPQFLTKRYESLVKMPITLMQNMYNVFPKVKRYAMPSSGESINEFLNLLSQGYERQHQREKSRSHFGFLSDKQFLDAYASIQSMREGIISLLQRNDRMGMSASIEARFPFLDEEVVRFAVNLPVKFKIGRSARFHNIMHPFLIDKAVVRKTCEPLLPPAIVNKKKLGFPVHGHRDMRVKQGYFQNGYVAQLMGMDAAAEEYMLRTQDVYYIAKLVSVDVFGRLFAMGESQETVTQRLKEFVSINVK